VWLGQELEILSRRQQTWLILPPYLHRHCQLWLTWPVADLARFPLVLEFRLVDVVGSVPPIPETTESTKDHDIRYYFYEMGRAEFTAVRDGHHVNVELGQYNKWSPGRPSSRHEMTFEVETYPRHGSALLTQNKLYVLELDDDDNATGSS
jgi:hypothetical protein